MDVRESVVLGQRKEDSSWTTALTLTAETAVTDASTGGALPFLRRKHIKIRFHVITAMVSADLCSDRIKQSFPDVFSVSVPQAGPTELTLNPVAVHTATARFRVYGLLAALMARGALEIYKEEAAINGGGDQNDIPEFVH